jgi:pimeloyl-ACP methyl ester carboxylesterase
VPSLPDGFASRTAAVKDFRMHYVIGGSGPAVVIVHGGFDSWWAWHKVIPALAQEHTVILPALRGLAKSSKPPAGYDADNLADDLYTMLSDVLALERFTLVGHDWGAVAGYCLAAAHPEAVARLAIYDMVMPGLGLIEEAMTPRPQGRFLWHMAFQSVPDIPELLIRSSLREYMQSFFTTHAAVPDAIDAEALDHYVALYSEAGALRAFLAYYENFWRHGEQVRAHAKTKLAIPVLAYGGEQSLGPLTKQCMEELADEVVGGVIPDCGHWVAAENPDFVRTSLQRFLRDQE